MRLLKLNLCSMKLLLGISLLYLLTGCATEKAPEIQQGQLCTQQTAYALGHYDAEAGLPKRSNYVKQCPHTATLVTNYYQQGYVAGQKDRKLHPHHFAHFMHSLDASFRKFAKLQNPDDKKAALKKGGKAVHSHKHLAKKAKEKGKYKAKHAKSKASDVKIHHKS